jgi:hypothetical protein
MKTEREQKREKSNVVSAAFLQAFEAKLSFLKACYLSLSKNNLV